MDPITQGNDANTQTETPAESPNQNASNQSPPASNQHEGFQRRIDELTARFHDERRAREQLQDQLTQTLQLVASRAQGEQQPQAPQFDSPEEAAKFQAVLSPFEQRLAQMERQYQARIDQMSVQLTAQQQGVDVAVAQRAQQLMNMWQRQGKSGWVPEDAIVYAEAQLAREARSQGQNANAQIRQYNAGQTPLAGHAPPPAPTPRTGPTQAEVDGWSIDKQLAFYEKLPDQKL